MIVSKHHKKVWAGPIVTAARSYWARRLVREAHVCPKCGLIVLVTDDWDVGHIIALDEGGPPSIRNTRPEHSGCNRGEGARMTNEKKRAKRNRIRSW